MTVFHSWHLYKWYFFWSCFFWKCGPIEALWGHKTPDGGFTQCVYCPLIKRLLAHSGFFNLRPKTYKIVPVSILNTGREGRGLGRRKGNNYKDPVSGDHMGHLSQLPHDGADKKIIKTLRCHPMPVIIDKKLVAFWAILGQLKKNTFIILAAEPGLSKWKFSLHTRRNWVGLCCHGMRKSIHILSGVKISSLLVSWTHRREQNKNQTLVWKSGGNDEQEQSGAEVHQLCHFPGQTFSRK